MILIEFGLKPGDWFNLGVRPLKGTAKDILTPI